MSGRTVVALFTAALLAVCVLAGRIEAAVIVAFTFGVLVMKPDPRRHR